MRLAWRSLMIGGSVQALSQVGAARHDQARSCGADLARIGRKTAGNMGGNAIEIVHVAQDQLGCLSAQFECHRLCTAKGGISHNSSTRRRGSGEGNLAHMGMANQE